MEWIGLVALAIMLCYASYPGKVRRLETATKKLKRKQRGENAMSKLINELVSHECKISTDDALQLVGSSQLQCFVIDADDEWIKVRFMDKKNNQMTKILRIDHIEEIEIIES